VIASKLLKCHGEKAYQPGLGSSSSQRVNVITNNNVKVRINILILWWWRRAVM